MRFLTTNALLAALICAIAFSAYRPAFAADDAAVRAADGEFSQAAAKGDTGALGKLLDADFQWIDVSGNLRGRAQVLKAVPKMLIPRPIANNLSPDSVRLHNYGQIAVTEADNDRLHVLRVWVMRPTGWRALVYQEVQSLDAPPKVTPSAAKECQNPCKSVGYTPKTQAERAVIESYEGLETAAMAQDAAQWDAHTAEEFIAASSNSDKLLDKPTRMAELRHANMAGLAPTPLISARLFQFGDATVMRSRHVPEHGKPLEVTRVFVMRDGKWLETLSYQTSVASAGPAL
jgi:hypothetical protein